MTCFELIVLSWLSVSNRFCDVMRGTDLAAGVGAFVPVPGATNLTGTPPQNTYTDSVSPASTGPFTASRRTSRRGG